jgi:hypothetical protein
MVHSFSAGSASILMRALEVNGAPSPQPSPGGSGGKRNGWPEIDWSRL